MSVNIHVDAFSLFIHIDSAKRTCFYCFTRKKTVRKRHGINRAFVRIFLIYRFTIYVAYARKSPPMKSTARMSSMSSYTVMYNPSLM